MLLDAVVQKGVEVGIAKSFTEEKFALNLGGCVGISLSDFGRIHT